MHDWVHSLIFQAPASAELKFCVGFEEVGWQVLTFFKSPEGGHVGAGPSLFYLRLKQPSVTEITYTAFKNI